MFISGQIPIIPATGEILRGDIKLQTKQVLENLKNILDAAGSCIDNVVKTTVFMKDLNDYTAINDVYKEFFTDKTPCQGRSSGGKAAPRDVGVEIEAILPLAFKKKI